MSLPRRGHGAAPWLHTGAVGAGEDGAEVGGEKCGNQGVFSGLRCTSCSLAPRGWENLALKDLAVLCGLSRVRPENDTTCVTDEGGASWLQRDRSESGLTLGVPRKG